MDKRPLPHPVKILKARDWLMTGCAASSKDARKSIKILWDLIEALPSHHPMYAFGSPEWKAKMGRPKKG